jgi:hypothetical protein
MVSIEMEFKSLKGFVSFASVPENSATPSHSQEEQCDSLILDREHEDCGTVTNHYYPSMAHLANTPPATVPTNYLAFPEIS